ncbi:M56 family metallopeptidase [Kolteria novifilia]
MTPPVVAWPWALSELGTAVSSATTPERPRPSGPAVSPRPQPQPLPSRAPTFAAPVPSKPNKLTSAASTSRPRRPTSVPSTLPVAVSRGAITTTPISAGPRTGEVLQAWTIPALLGLWLAGGAIALAVQIRRLRRLRAVRHRGRPADTALEAEIAHVAAALGTKPVRALVVDELPAPYLWCAPTPTLLWPESLTSPEKLAQSRAVLAHELAHVRRRDHWVAWLEMAAGVAWWWNPLWWLVRRRLHETSEIACDAIALEVDGDRRRYAELFLALSSRLDAGTLAPALGVGTGRRSSFERRVRMILSDRVSGALSARGMVLMVCLAALALPNWTLADPKPREVPPSRRRTDAPREREAHQPVSEEELRHAGVHQIQLELHELDIQDAGLRLEAEHKKLEQTEQSIKQGEMPQEGLKHLADELRVNVRHLEIEHRRAILRKELFLRERGLDHHDESDFHHRERMSARERRLHQLEAEELEVKLDAARKNLLITQKESEQERLSPRHLIDAEKEVRLLEIELKRARLEAGLSGEEEATETDGEASRTNPMAPYQGQWRATSVVGDDEEGIAQGVSVNLAVRGNLFVMKYNFAGEGNAALSMLVNHRTGGRPGSAEFAFDPNGKDPKRSRG